MASKSSPALRNLELDFQLIPENEEVAKEGGKEREGDNEEEVKEGGKEREGEKDVDGEFEAGSGGKGLGWGEVVSVEMGEGGRAIMGGTEGISTGIHREEGHGQDHEGGRRVEGEEEELCAGIGEGDEGGLRGGKVEGGKNKIVEAWLYVPWSAWLLGTRGFEEICLYIYLKMYMIIFIYIYTYVYIVWLLRTRDFKEMYVYIYLYMYTVYINIFMYVYVYISTSVYLCV